MPKVGYQYRNVTRRGVVAVVEQRVWGRSVQLKPQVGKKFDGIAEFYSDCNNVFERQWS